MAACCRAPRRARYPQSPLRQRASFLDYFGLKSLDELPPLAQLQAIGDMNLQLALPAEEGAAESLPAAASSYQALDADERR